MEAWLRCSISPGMFNGEVGVEGKQFDGAVFSLFAPEESVEHDTLQKESEPSAGWVKVEITEEKGDLALVKLPRHTLQNGAYITVRSEQIQMRRQKQLS